MRHAWAYCSKTQVPDKNPSSASRTSASSDNSGLPCRESARTDGSSIINNNSKRFWVSVSRADQWFECMERSESHKHRFSGAPQWKKMHRYDAWATSSTDYIFVNSCHEKDNSERGTLPCLLWDGNRWDACLYNIWSLRMAPKIVIDYLEWLAEHVTGPMTLLWDLFTAHRDDVTNERASALCVRFVFIPSGMAGRSEPLGKSIFENMKRRVIW
jgi:hypothetical protein